MLIRITEDSKGNVTARPVSARITASMIKDAGDNGAPVSFDGSIFLQQPSIEDVRETFGSQAVWRGEVNDGAKIRIDDLDYRHMIGYANN